MFLLYFNSKTHILLKIKNEGVNMRYFQLMGAICVSSMCILLAACQSQPTANSKKQGITTTKATQKVAALPVIQSKDGVQDIRWTLSLIKNKKALFFNQMPNLLLQSNNQRVFGHTGCNTLYGSYQIDAAKQTIRFQTKAGHQACDNALAQEAELLDALARVTTFKLQGQQIYFYDAQRQMLLQAQR